jgi:1-aminocyclopropane-1-carboxylate deaminase/D-cysteine desulfhydrase-like pyridoxal-dependent ACC family enzyme
MRPTHVYVCSAGPTGAGLALGAKLLGVAWKLVSVAPIRWPFPSETKMAAIAANAAAHLGVDVRLEPGEIDVRSEYVGPEYGVLTPGAREAIDLAARTEGMVLDPVYTAKALAGLIDHARTGKLTARDTVVFIHTGGSPALFAYAPELTGGSGSAVNRSMPDA